MRHHIFTNIRLNDVCVCNKHSSGSSNGCYVGLIEGNLESPGFVNTSAPASQFRCILIGLCAHIPGNI